MRAIRRGETGEVGFPLGQELSYRPGQSIAQADGWRNLSSRWQNVSVERCRSALRARGISHLLEPNHDRLESCLNPQLIKVRRVESSSGNGHALKSSLVHYSLTMRAGSCNSVEIFSREINYVLTKGSMMLNRSKVVPVDPQVLMVASLKVSRRCWRPAYPNVPATTLATSNTSISRTSKHIRLNQQSTILTQLLPPSNPQNL